MESKNYTIISNNEVNIILSLLFTSCLEISMLVVRSSSSPSSSFNIVCSSFSSVVKSARVSLEYTINTSIEGKYVTVNRSTLVLSAVLLIYVFELHKYSAVLVSCLQCYNTRGLIRVEMNKEQAYLTEASLSHSSSSSSLSSCVN